MIPTEHVEPVSKEKAVARSKVENPGVQTVPTETEPQLIPEEKAPLIANVPEKKPTLGSVLGQQWLKGIGADQGITAPAGLNQGAPDKGAMEQGATAPPAFRRPGFKPIPGLEPEATSLIPNAPAAPTGKEAFKAKIAGYDKQYQDLMDRAATDNDPAVAEQAARVKEAKLAYEKQHPWGSAESARPGILGKLGHVAEMIASRAPGFAPIVATIPGSEGYRAGETAGAREQAKEASKQEAEQDKKTQLPGYKQVTGGAIDPNATGDMKGVPQVAFVNEKNPNEVIYRGPITAKTGAGGDKKAFQGTLAKIGTPEVAKPETQMAAIEQAHTDKTISDEEYSNAMAYLGSTANAPATQASVAQTKEEKKRADSFRGKVLVFQNPDGSREGMTYAEAKAQNRDLDAAMKYEPLAADKLRTAGKSYQNTVQMFGQYEKDMSKPLPLDKEASDVHAMQVLTSHLDDNPDMAMKFANDLLNILPNSTGTNGTPLTNEQLAVQNGVMTKNQWDNMSPAARERVSDYYQAMLSHFQSIKDTQGSIPRNPVMIKTEMGAIPLPYLTKEEAKPAFDRYYQRMHNMNVDTVRFGRKVEPDDVTGEICTRWNERESTWRKSGSCQSKGTSQSRS